MTGLQESLVFVDGELVLGLVLTNFGLKQTLWSVVSGHHAPFGNLLTSKTFASSSPEVRGSRLSSQLSQGPDTGLLSGPPWAYFSPGGLGCAPLGL